MIVACSLCGKYIDAPDPDSEPVVRCPSCGLLQRAAAPEAKGPEAPPEEAAPQDDDWAYAPVFGRKCPGCGKWMTPGAVVCMACGYDPRTGEKWDDAKPLPPPGALSPAAGDESDTPAEDEPREDRLGRLSLGHHRYGRFADFVGKGAALGIPGGIVMMGLAALWFLAGRSWEIDPLYPAILFVVGALALVKGLFGGKTRDG